MTHFLRSILLPASLVLAAVPLNAQALTRQNIASILGFENGTAGQFPARWNGTATGIVADDQAPQEGRLSARIERTADNTEFSTITAGIPFDFEARVIELRGFVKTQNVRDSIALWLRLDGISGSLAFATLQTQQIRGTTNWTEYSIRLNVVPNGRLVAFGFLLSGPGRAWVDNMQLLADGKPVAQAPNRTPTVFETDTEFNAYSGLALTELSDLQVSNLATLAKVWGFVKYHHPTVAAGKRHWDYDLFRAMSKVLAAEDTSAAHNVMLAWIEGIGPVPDCTRCATLNENELYLAPDIDWIRDSSKLGDGLSNALQTIHRNRPAEPQFFVELNPGVSNPNFERELNYPGMHFPDSAYQLLALFRFWNMMQYFNPNRDTMVEERVAGDPQTASSAYWNLVLENSIRGFALAKDRTAYLQELLLFNTKVNDTHSNIWSAISARPPVGACQLPVDIRFVEGKAIVTSNAAINADAAGPLKAGDIILRLDDKPVDDLVTEWRPYYAASNEPTRLRDIGRYMTRGSCGPAAVTIDRDNQTLDVTADRVANNAIDFSRYGLHDLPGPAFQKLADDIAYLKLSSVRIADSAEYIRQAAGTKGLIIDIRNYPSEFVVFSLGGLLVSEPTDFVRFTRADLANPGAFNFSGKATLTPLQPRYTGKVVILIDEVSQSQAEYTTMAFRTAPGAIVVGSTTAGADGNVSLIPLPGGQNSYISGIGIYYPDKRPTQRVGIIPDIELKPTIAGIRSGKDELLDEAIRQIRAER